MTKLNLFQQCYKVSWCFKPSQPQPQKIILGLMETFIKRFSWLVFLAHSTARGYIRAVIKRYLAHRDALLKDPERQMKRPEEQSESGELLGEFMK